MTLAEEKKSRPIPWQQVTHSLEVFVLVVCIWDLDYFKNFIKKNLRIAKKPLRNREDQLKST